MGSLNNLLESSSIEDSLDSETSITPSPVPSLTEVLRSGGKLEPGLPGKPPIPPPGHTFRKDRSLDDLINIKFQRWFPAEIQDSYSDTVAQLTRSSAARSKNYSTTNLKACKSSENLSDLRNSSGTPETQIMLNYPMQFEGYDSPRLDSSKKLPRSHTMETIHESEDQVPLERVQANTSSGIFPHKLENGDTNESSVFLKSKIGQSLNRFFGGSDPDAKEKQVANHENIGDSGNQNSGILQDERDKTLPVEKSGSETEGVGVAVNNVEKQSPISSFQEHNGFLQLDGTHRSGLNNEDILSWMGNNNTDGSQDKALGSTYNDILKMLKVLEKEEVESLKLESLSVNRSNNNSACSNITPAGTSCRDILTYLDDLDRSDVRLELHQTEVKSAAIESQEALDLPGGRLSRLMSLDQAKLAQKVMTLTLELEGKSVECERAESRLSDTSDKLAKHKAQSDTILKRHQAFIDRLLQEKRMLGDQCASIVTEMEEKHKKTLASMESRHEVEMKKLQEKMLAAEKVRREKWENDKIRRIKEQTVKGIEPELERLTRAHADELSELRRSHDRELSEIEAACSRRIAASREQALRDREQAVQEEREAARSKLECELSEVERSYQEQRRRLLQEVREEKERLEREAQASLAMRARKLEEKWAKAEAQLQEKLAAVQETHQNEMKNLRETLEGERQSWLDHQTLSLTQKEKEIREVVKRERDRHIEAVIRKLDQEALEKEKAVEAKLARMKEDYEKELKESEESLHNMKRKLKDTRSEAQENEDVLSKFRSQITQLECQVATYKQQIERMEFEKCEVQVLARSEASSQIAALQHELREEKLKRDQAIAAVQAEKERELQQVYNRFKDQKALTAALRKASLEMANLFERVKEAITKKDETVKMVGKQRDAALEQCAQLENMLELQRKELPLRK